MRDIMVFSELSEDRVVRTIRIRKHCLCNSIHCAHEKSSLVSGHLRHLFLVTPLSEHPIKFSKDINCRIF
jgi:hypothetical protein